MKAYLVDTNGNIFKTIDVQYPALPSFYMAVYNPISEARFWDEQEIPDSIATIKTLEFDLVDDVDDFIEWDQYEKSEFRDFEQTIIYKLRSSK
jgi:hypothetical protein